MLVNNFWSKERPQCWRTDSKLLQTINTKMCNSETSTDSSTDKIYRIIYFVFEWKLSYVAMHFICKWCDMRCTNISGADLCPLSNLSCSSTQESGFVQRCKSRRGTWSNNNPSCWTWQKPLKFLNHIWEYANIVFLKIFLHSSKKSSFAAYSSIITNGTF